MSLMCVSLPNLKVLVVDDSRTARAYIENLLREMNVGATELAEDGADAIAKLRCFPADLVVCDLHMAPLDGIEFTRLLRDAADSPNPFVPVLMLTADATATQLRNALDAGVHGFMSKPVRLEALRRQIAGLFAQPMVFLREGGHLRPLRPPRHDEPQTAGKPAAAAHQYA